MGGWEGGSKGRGYIYIFICVYIYVFMADSCYMAETNTTLQSNFPPTKNKNK